MNYIWNHHKLIVFDVIKTRANSINIEFFYITFIEIIQKLHNHFDNFDKFTLYNMKFYNLAFAIKIIKKNEIFNEFYARFSIIIVLLNYFKSSKIRVLKRFFTHKFRYRIINDFKPTSFRHYIKRIRIINQNMRFWARQIRVKEIKKNEFLYEFSSNTKNSIIDYLSDFKIKLKGRYFKYLGYDYKSDPKISYANNKHLFYEKVKARLIKKTIIEKN